MENIKGFKRSGYCGDWRLSDAGKSVSLCGWAARVRDLGSLIFIDLRDRSGLLQLAFDEKTPRDIFEKAASVRSEYVLAVSGIIRERSAKNPELPTGEIELEVTELRLLARSEVPPFEIIENCNAGEALRLKYRYLDLRRPELQRNMLIRHKITKIARDYYDSCGFLEIETPMLTKSTPEGARDYLVPSRVHQGSFYALPQSPQQYKQLLMLSGFDRYMQIVRCFRDEDLRADRQPEFTQIDLEMSFVDVEDVISVNEGFIKKVFKELLDVGIESPFPRLTYAEAMDRFGSDKPDLRFGLELISMSDIAAGTQFQVFNDAVSSGGSVRMLSVPGGAAFSRKEIDSLVEFVKTYKAKGLAWLKLSGGSFSSSFAKFMTEEQLQSIIARAGAADGDLILIVADKNSVVYQALGALRCEIARRMGLINKNDYRLLWVTEFPLLEYSETDNRFVAMHHPFTSPMDEDLNLLDTDPGAVRAKAYDIVLNGTELGGGSIRIFSTELQAKMFSCLGFTPEAAQAQFGHLLEAFKYGVPPHGGLAYGLDRLVMLMLGTDSIRDVIAFPKVQNASELMTSCPSEVAEAQLDELGLEIKKKSAE